MANGRKVEAEDDKELKLCLRRAGWMKRVGRRVIRQDEGKGVKKEVWHGETVDSGLMKGFV